MLRLPASLEKHLKEIFPRASDREKFVKETVEEALIRLRENDPSQPEAIGGTLHLFTDGGSRGNPGEAAIGCVLLDPHTDAILREYREAIGIHTNNEAEYLALIAGLELAWKFHPNHIVCHLDSELIVKQLSHEYRVKMETLQPLFEETERLASRFKHISFCHVPREKNRRADRLVNEALDRTH